MSEFPDALIEQAAKKRWEDVYDPSGDWYVAWEDAPEFFREKQRLNERAAQITKENS